MTELKLRASWGKTVFMAIQIRLINILYMVVRSAILIMIFMGQVIVLFTGLPGSVLVNPKTGWQEDVVTNIGIECVLWKGKLSVTADLVFIKKQTGYYSKLHYLIF